MLHLTPLPTAASAAAEKRRGGGEPDSQIRLDYMPMKFRSFLYTRMLPLLNLSFFLPLGEVFFFSDDF